MEGILIPPELIEKLKVVQSPQELMEVCKDAGIELNEEAAKKWFEKLDSGEHSARLHLSANDGGCSGTVTCPQCGSSDYSQRYIPFDIYGDGMVHCHCNSCGYTKDYY